MGPCRGWDLAALGRGPLKRPFPRSQGWQRFSPLQLRIWFWRMHGRSCASNCRRPGGRCAAHYLRVKGRGRAKGQWEGAWVRWPPGAVGIVWEAFQAGPGELGAWRIRVDYSERWIGKAGEKGRHYRQPLNLRPPKAGFVHLHLVATARNGIEAKWDLAVVHVTGKSRLASGIARSRHSSSVGLSFHYSSLLSSCVVSPTALLSQELLGQCQVSGHCPGSGHAQPQIAWKVLVGLSWAVAPPLG